VLLDDMEEVGSIEISAGGPVGEALVELVEAEELVENAG